MITICMTHFKSLALSNFAAALYSVRWQALSKVSEIVIVDNDSQDSAHELRTIADALAFPVPVRIYSFKHGDATKTHSWSTNKAVSLATSELVLFTRSDYLLDFDVMHQFVSNWDYPRFVTSDGRHLHVPIADVEKTSWRENGLKALDALHGTTFDYTVIDTGVWMTSKVVFDAVGGLDEKLTAWGHAQTDFQYRLYKSGVQFVRVPEVLFQHPHHGGDKDINVAHAQLAMKGGNLKEMWSRYHGVSPY